MAVTLRRAVLTDQPLLEKWDRDPAVVFATGSEVAFESNWGEELSRNVPWEEILIAEEDGRPIGVVCLIDPHLDEEHYWGDCEPHLRALDIWLGEPADRGRGLGTRVMELALARCFEAADVTAVIIDPLVTNVRAIAFYERLGFRHVERRMLHGDDTAVMRMTRDEWATASARPAR